MIHHILTRPAENRAEFEDKSRWLRQLAALWRKEFPQLFRDRAIFIYICFTFTVQILIAAGMQMELHNASIVVRDSDQSKESRELIRRIRPPYFQSAQSVDHPDQAMRLLDRGNTTLYLDIPPDFSNVLMGSNQSATVQMMIDTTRTVSGYLAASYSARIIQAYGTTHIEDRLLRSQVPVSKLPDIGYQRRNWFNETINESWFATIAELISQMTIACILLPAIALVREKERGTLEQLSVSPVSPVQIMLAKIGAMIVVIWIAVAISLLGIMHMVFSLPIRGSLPLFFVTTALYAFSMASLGLVAATYTRTSGQIGMILLLIVMPLLLLSGMWTMLESMPSWLRHAMNFSPLRHYVDIAFGILLRGADFAELWQPIAAVCLIGFALFTVALWRFERQ